MMRIQVVKATSEDKQLIRNFMQFYMYDFTEFMHLAIQPDGLFQSYPQLDDYWVDSDRFPYLIKDESVPVGFVFVRWTGNFFSIAEFFILRQYRRAGVGSSAAREVFKKHKGPWQVFQIERNKPAQQFWQKVIARYSNGEFSNNFESGKWVQRFESS